MSRPQSGNGYSIFHETMADMTFPELVQAAADRAVVLWGLGVIEQHGPHLPLGTDVYMPSALLRQVRHLLGARNINSVIMPPFYWGVNHVTGLFPGSFEVRPQIMIELMIDLIKSLRKDNFSTLFCVSGHGDALHNRTLLDGLRRGAAESGVKGYFVGGPAFFKRLGFDPADPCLLPTAAEAEGKSAYFDVHAGAVETSPMWALYPELVRTELLPMLRPTQFDAGDMAEWRKGRGEALRKTPDGYLGDPAASDPETGARMMAEHAAIVAGAIADKVRGADRD
jgi:creatinine amidohydrolase